MKDVIITLRGFSGSEQKLDFVTEGKYYKKGNLYYVTYHESEMTGLGNTTTMLKVGKETVTLIRQGSVNSNFVFKEGMVNRSQYVTEFGEFTVEIRANKVQVDMNDDGGVIEMDYLLDMSDGKGAINTFSMTVKEVKKYEYHQ